MPANAFRIFSAEVVRVSISGIASAAVREVVARSTRGIVLKCIFVFEILPFQFFN